MLDSSITYCMVAYPVIVNICCIVGVPIVAFAVGIPRVAGFATENMSSVFYKVVFLDKII